MNSYKTGKYTDRQRLGKIAALIGSNSDWNKAFDRMVLVDKGKDNHKLAKALFMNHNTLNASGYKNAANQFRAPLKIYSCP